MSFLSSVFILICYGLTICDCVGQVPKLTGSSRYPRSPDAYQETKACLICIFNTSAPLTVTWLRNGIRMSYDDRVKSRNIMRVSGRTMNQLCINKLKTNDTGTYKCIGSNKHGQGDSATLSLKVIGFYKPVIDKNSPPDKVVLYKGQSMSLDCIADGYPTVEKYTWSKKSGFIDKRWIKSVQNGLFFSYATSEQAGEYICNAENSQGKDFKSVQVSVVNDPSWEKTPENVTLDAGSTFSLSCSFYGSLKDIKVTWYLNNKELPVETIPRKSKDGQPHLVTYTVPSAQAQHSGRYVLEIRNKNGKISSAVSVYVYAKPDVVINEGNELMATVGQVIQITCEAQGHPAPSVTWNSDGRVLAQTSLGSNYNGHIKSISTYLIYPVEGIKTYVCIGKNERGTDKESIKIITKGKSAVSDRNANKQAKASGDSKIPIIIAATSAVVIILVILALIFVIKYRRKEKRNPSSHADAAGKDQISSISSLPGEQDEEEKLEESAMLIEEPLYITPNSFKHSSKPKQSRVSFKKPSLRMRSDNGTFRSRGNSLEGQYCVLLPIGQGRLLSYEDLSIEEQCGTGQFGNVAKGTLNEENSEPKEVAIKMLKDNAGLAERKMMLDELKIMKALSHHPNVIALIGWVITDDNVYIVEELVTNGSLLHFLRSERLSLQRIYANVEGSSISEKDALTFAWQVASGMKYLSSQDIVHRDLAARNILLGQENICKIADFGLARQVYRNTSYSKTTAGELPVRWMAYESVFNGIYTSASDVWSFGVLLWEIISLGDIPYSELPNIGALVQHLKDQKRMKKPVHISDELYRLMMQCWSQLPSMRPDFSDLTNRLGQMLFDKECHINYSGLENYLEKEQEDLEEMEDPENMQNFRDQRPSIISEEMEI